MDNMIVKITFIIAGIGCVCCLVYCFIAARKTRKNNKEQLELEENAPERVQPEELPVMEEIYATVADLRCEVKMVGMQTPKTIKSFVVVFQNRSREYLSFQVPEEMYHGLEIGQKGMLTYVDESLYGFALEEI